MLLQCNVTRIALLMTVKSHLQPLSNESEACIAAATTIEEYRMMLTPSYLTEHNEIGETDADVDAASIRGLAVDAAVNPCRIRAE